MKKNNFFVNLYQDINNDKSNIREIICFCLFCFGIIFISFFHEPWYDEFHAWAISKESIANIMFLFPHYEGHPPLWHLILKCFTSFIQNPELAIKIPNISFMIASVWLLLFKSPFKRPIKFVLPFTYFIFYQYSIVNRPYCVLIFALFLAASLDKTKNERPFRYIFALSLLSLSSIYGMLLSVGLVITWVFEIWNKQKFSDFLKSFLLDKRFYSMLILFVLCAFVSFVELLPKYTQVGSLLGTNSKVITRLFYFIFCIPSDATITNLMPFNNPENVILWHLLFAAIFSIYLNIALFIFFKQNKKTILFLSTYGIFLAFALFGYFWPTHLGILTMVILYLFWNTIQSAPDCNVKISKHLLCVMLIAICVQVYWSISATYMEVRFQYEFSRQLANYIKENNLEGKRIFTQWACQGSYKDKKGKKVNPFKLKITDYNPNLYIDEYVCDYNTSFYASITNPYFGKNIFYNFNTLRQGRLAPLNLSVISSKMSWGKYIDKFLEPDVIIGGDIISQPYLHPHYFDEFLGKDFYKKFINEYKEEAYFLGNQIFKDKVSTRWANVYIRKVKK